MGWIHGYDDECAPLRTQMQVAGDALSYAERQIAKAIAALVIAPAPVSDACGGAEWDEDNGLKPMSAAHRAELSAWHAAYEAARWAAEVAFAASVDAIALLATVETAREALAALESAGKAKADVESDRRATLTGWVVCASRDSAASAAAALQIPRWDGRHGSLQDRMALTVLEAARILYVKNPDRYEPEMVGAWDEAQIIDVGFRRELEAVLKKQGIR